MREDAHLAGFEAGKKIPENEYIEEVLEMIKNQKIKKGNRITIKLRRNIPYKDDRYQGGFNFEGGKYVLNQISRETNELLCSQDKDIYGREKRKVKLKLYDIKTIKNLDQAISSFTSHIMGTD